MTIVAYSRRAGRAGVIACDSRACWENEPCPTEEPKIRALRHGVTGNGAAVHRFLVGSSGSRAQSALLLKHWLFGERIGGMLVPFQPVGDHLTALIVIRIPRAVGDSVEVTVVGRDGNETNVTGKFATLGSGADFATGALAAGATPVTACEIACDHNVHCAGPIHMFDIAEVIGWTDDRFEEVLGDPKI